MPTEKKTPKPPKAPGPLFVPAGALHALPKRALAQEAIATILAQADDLIGRYIAGESFKSIAESMDPPIPAWRIRSTLVEHEDTKDRWRLASLNRAHNLVEEAVDMARVAGTLGDAAGYRVAVDTFLKVAGKLAPTEYGDKNKVELTGAGGGPLKILTMSDEQLMEIAAAAHKKVCEEGDA